MKDECVVEVTRGTTPSIIYTFKTVDVSTITKAALTFEQRGKILLEKSLADASLKAKALSWTLTQEDSLSIKGEVEVMLNWVTSDGLRGASKVMDINFKRNHKETVL